MMFWILLWSCMVMGIMSYGVYNTLWRLILLIQTPIVYTDGIRTVLVVVSVCLAGLILFIPVLVGGRER